MGRRECFSAASQHATVASTITEKIIAVNSNLQRLVAWLESWPFTWSLSLIWILLSHMTAQVLGFVKCVSLLSGAWNILCLSKLLEECFPHSVGHVWGRKKCLGTICFNLLLFLTTTTNKQRKKSNPFLSHYKSFYPHCSAWQFTALNDLHLFITCWSRFLMLLMKLSNN